MELYDAKYQTDINNEPYGSLKPGMCIYIDKHPCTITHYTTAKPGKHGTSKTIIKGVDIFTNRKHDT